MKFLSVLLFMVILYLPCGTGKTLPKSQDDQSTLSSDNLSAEDISSKTMKVKGKSPNLLEDDSSADPASFPLNLGKLKNILKKIPHRWTAKEFIKLIKELGMFSVKDLKLIRASAALLKQLKKNKNHIIDNYKPPKKPCSWKLFDEPTKGLEDKDEKLAKKRERLLDLCHETYSTMYILAHPSGLTYKIPNAHCPARYCHSNSMGRNIGRCLRKIKAMVVYVINEHYQFKPKTIESGCSCECHHYSFMG